jgi:hypothetical protein
MTRRRLQAARRARRVSRWVVVVLVGAVAATAAVTSAWAPAVVEPAVPERPAVRLDPPQPVLVVGDSAIAAVRWVPGAATAVLGIDHTLDLESCRRLVAPSCRGREGRTPPTALEAIRATKGTYHTVVVATGYNDGAPGFEASFRAIVDQARSQGVERIVWFTLRDDVTYVSPGELGQQATFAANNATLRGLVSSGAYPDVTIADWDAYTTLHPEWFTADGVHYRPVAAWAAADYLSRTMASLDGRPCPMPFVPNGPRPDPCPDPDLTGPIADLDALYSIGTGGVVCYEVGDAHDVVCSSSPAVPESPELARR